MKTLTNNIKIKIEKEVKNLLPDLYNITYDPKCPRADKTTFSWFQIIFAIGPGKDEKIKEQCFVYIPTLFEIFKKHEIYKFSDIVGIRIRRRTKDSPFDHPYMYIEVGCNGDKLKYITFENWYEQCFTYINRFDVNDEMNKIQNKKLEEYKTKD
jgi:hypothetical protein